MVGFDFSFTAQDKELLGGSRYADPLGAGPVWTNLARRLVPNLTAQSTRAQGFQLLLCGVDFYERYVEAQDGDPDLEFRDFYVLLEQAFAHSTYRRREGKRTERERWPLPGSRAVRAASGQVKLGLGHGLLDSQYAGGTWGLYSAAAERSSLVRTEPTRLNDAVRSHVRGAYRSRGIAGQLDDVFRAIRKAYKDSYAINRAAWADDLAKVLDTLPHRDLLREQLIERPKYATPAGYPQAHIKLLAEVARRLRQKAIASNSEQHQDGEETGEGQTAIGSLYRDFSEECAAFEWDADEFGAAKQIFRDIVIAERFLAPIGNLFEALFDHHGRKTADVAARLAPPVKELEEAKAAFGTLRYWSATARHRAQLYAGLDCSSPQHLVDSLVSTHSAVAESRGRSPWLLSESGSLIAVIEQPSAPNPDLSPATAWRNTYYLPSLLSLAEDLDVN